MRGSVEKKRFLVCALCVGLMIWMTACSTTPAVSSSAAATSEPIVVGKVTEDEVGLMGFADPTPEGFQVAIVPLADDNIFEMTMEYALDGQWEGQQTMVTEDGSCFGPMHLVQKTFSVDDLPADEDIPPLSISFMFRDKDGNQTASANTYTIDAPQREGQYVLNIRGTWDQGYELTSE